jgi:hypothetical protein
MLVPRGPVAVARLDRVARAARGGGATSTLAAARPNAALLSFARRPPDRGAKKRRIACVRRTE